MPGQNMKGLPGTDPFWGALYPFSVAWRAQIRDVLYSTSLAPEIDPGGRRGLHCRPRRSFAVRHTFSTIGSLIMILILQTAAIVERGHGRGKFRCQRIWSVIGCRSVFDRTPVPGGQNCGSYCVRPANLDTIRFRRWNRTMKTVEEIQREAMRLSAGERASLTHDLILSLENPDAYELSPSRRLRFANASAGSNVARR